MKKLGSLLVSLIAAISIAVAGIVVASNLAQRNETVQAATQYLDYSDDSFNVYINSAPLSRISGLDLPAGNSTGTLFIDGSSWPVVRAAKTDDGKVWYNIRGNEWEGSQWIDAQYANAFRIVPYNATVTIKYTPGYGIAMWSTPESEPFKVKELLPDKLSDGTSWKTYRKATLNDGKIWYNLGGNQWIDGEYAVVN